MEGNTSVEFAYLLLQKGVHLREIQRFVDSAVAVDLHAETIPTPPSSKDGSRDPETASTAPCSGPMPREERLAR